jgi:hypothetical protein
MSVELDAAFAFGVATGGANIAACLKVDADRPGRRPRLWPAPRRRYTNLSDKRAIWRDRMMTWSAFHVARHTAAKITVMCELG